MRARSCFLSVFLLVLAACDSGVTSAAIGGVYTGIATVGSSSLRYTMTLPTTSEGAFTWTGTIEGDQLPDPFPFGGTGTYDHPNITLTEATGDEPSVITGTVSADRDTITLVDEDDGEPITLVLRRSG